ncbi:MAG: hypothetical protein ACOYL5_05550 [Phototrophicaceae bacterium]
MKRVLLGCFVLWASYPLWGVSAQSATLPAYGSVQGQIAADQSETWFFRAVEGELVSLIVEPTSDLDPTLTLRSETGALLTQNDDYDYPNSRSAVLQAVTIPFTGQYSVEISGFGGSVGTYTLTRLRGYAQAEQLNGFANASEWVASGETLQLGLAPNALSLSLSGISQSGVAYPPRATPLGDAYTHVAVTVNARPGWVVGMTARQARPDQYYLFAINHLGGWQLVLRDGETETILRDWGTHPAIRAGETSFDLGILSYGQTVEVFYNGSSLGSVEDATLESGITGVYGQTANALDSAFAATFSDLRVTVPRLTAQGGELLPIQIILGNVVDVANALAHMRAIPSGGELVLDVSEIVVQSNDVGVSRFPLGRGSTFTNFVISSEVTIQANFDDPAGCGLYMRAVDDETYLMAYLDQTGAYGLSERRGQTFFPGVFGQEASLARGEHQLLLIANGNTVRYYMDGRYVGELLSAGVAGSIGNAIINFEPNATNCRYENTWLWRWD